VVTVFFDKSGAIIKISGIHGLQKGVFIPEMPVQGGFTYPQFPGNLGETCGSIKIPPPDLEGGLNDIIPCHKNKQLPTVR